MQTTRFAAAVLTAICLGVAGSAWANHHEEIAARFKAADKDADGTLDKDEAKALPRVAKNFDQLDADKDGTVTLDEIMAGMKGKAKGKQGKGHGMFAEADKDKVGTLDREEAKAMPKVAENFDKIDTDKDGTVSMEEIHSFMMGGKKP